MAPATPASFTSCSRVLGSSRACCTNARGFSSSPEMVVMVDSPSTRASVAAATGARAQAPAHVREHNSTGRLCQAAAATTMGNMWCRSLASARRCRELEAWPADGTKRDQVFSINYFCQKNERSEYAKVSRFITQSIAFRPNHRLQWSIAHQLHHGHTSSRQMLRLLLLSPHRHRRRHRPLHSLSLVGVCRIPCRFLARWRRAVRAGQGVLRWDHPRVPPRQRH